MQWTILEVLPNELYTNVGQAARSGNARQSVRFSADAFN